MLSAFPQELVAEIIRCIDTPVDLYACALVCRRFREPSQRTLFSNISFSRQFDNADQALFHPLKQQLLIHAVNHYPRLSSYIHRLHDLELAYQDTLAYFFFAKILRTMTQLRSLTLCGRLSLEAFAQRPEMYTATLPTVEAISLEGVHHLDLLFFEQFPNLRFLDLFRTLLRHDPNLRVRQLQSAESPKPPPFDQMVALSLKPDSVEELNYMGGWVLVNAPVAVICPNLKQLSIDLMGCRFLDEELHFTSLWTVYRVISNCARSLERLQIDFNFQLDRFADLLASDPIPFPKLRALSVSLAVFWDGDDIDSQGDRSNDRVMCAWIEAMTALPSLETFELHLDMDSFDALSGRVVDQWYVDELPLMTTMRRLESHWLKMAATTQRMPRITVVLSCEGEPMDAFQQETGADSHVERFARALPRLVATGKFTVKGDRRETWSALDYEETLRIEAAQRVEADEK